MKNIFFLLFFLLVINIYAIEKSPCNIPKTCCDKITNDSLAFSYPTDNEFPCSRNNKFYADFLYMNFNLDIDYGFIINSLSNYNDHTNFYPGFRIGFNSSFMKEFYIDINWTYLKIKTKSSYSFEQEKIIGTFLPPDDFIVMKAASSKKSGDFNTADLKITKPYYINRYFISNPSFGIRTAWIDQSYLVRYFINNIKTPIINKNEYFGIGLSSSYEALFKIHKYVNFYSNALFSLLFGKFNIWQHSLTNYENIKYQINNSFFQVNSNAEISLGVLFNYFTKKYKITGKIGYEFHYWWNQIHLQHFMNLNPVSIKEFSQNDLSFNGFTAGLSIEL